jgi:hypothetical protein
VKNCQLSDAMAAARAAGVKSVTRRLTDRYRAGDVVYHGESLVRYGSSVFYRRDLVGVRTVETWRWQRDGLPGRFCPQRFARLFSMIRSVRSEPLQCITEEDARREGAEPASCEPACDCAEWSSRRHVLGFQLIWDSINSDHPWASNPLVFVVELGPLLSREEAARLAGIKDLDERLELGRRAA